MYGTHLASSGVQVPEDFVPQGGAAEIFRPDQNGPDFSPVLSSWQE